MTCPACGSDHVSIDPRSALCVCLDCAEVWGLSGEQVQAAFCGTCGRPL